MRGSFLHLPQTLGGILGIELFTAGHDWRGILKLNGEWLAEDLVPGTYELRLTCDALGQTLLTLKNLKVRSGETLSDPRLQALDLEPLVRLHHFRFERTEGKPLNIKHIEVLLSSGRGKKLRLSGRESREVLVPTEYESFSFGLQGFQPVEVSLQSKEVLVRLQPAE